MARSHARLMATIWDDDDFLDLSATGQRLYMFLLSQTDLQHCGVIPLRERRWSKKAKNMSVGDVERDLKELAAASPRPFVIIDEDTEELLVRSLMRRDKVYAQPNVFKSAAEQIRAVSSRTLKAAILEELRRLPAKEMKGDARQVLAGLIADLERTAVTPSGTPSPSTYEHVPGGSAQTAPAPSDEVANGTDAHEGTSAHPSGVSAGHEVEAAPSLTPSEQVPSKPRGKGSGYGGEVEGSPSPLPLAVPPPAGTATPRPDADATAQTILAEWIDRCQKRPPGQVIGQIGKHVKSMLGEGIDPDDIRRGLADWMIKDVHPSVLPSLVNSVMNTRSTQRDSGRSSPSPSRNSQILDAAMERAIAAEKAMAEQAEQRQNGRILKGELTP